MTLLQIHHLHLSAGDKPILHDIHFTLKNNRTLAIVGESGSGKSSLAHALIGLNPPHFSQQGELVLNGEIIRDFTPIRGKKIGLMPQNAMSAFNPLQSLAAQWRETLRWHKVVARHAENALMTQYLSQVQLPAEVLSRYPNELSGGQLQRIMLAITLSLSPQIVIADEPTSALDSQTQQRLIPLFRQISTPQRSLIFITHDIALAQQLADDIAVFHQGKLIECQATQDLFSCPQMPYTRYLLAMRERLNSPLKEKNGLGENDAIAG